ncbi:hypothetical protein C8Q74DRAFT_726906 [Fomes fomentarius]|nr:hypothetical protein C8Q74DRAFT_726906 [Fomes fomentarius]
MTQKIRDIRCHFAPHVVLWVLHRTATRLVQPSRGLQVSQSRLPCPVTYAISRPTSATIRHVTPLLVTSHSFRRDLLGPAHRSDSDFKFSPPSLCRYPSTPLYPSPISCPAFPIIYLPCPSAKAGSLLVQFTRYLRIRIFCVFSVDPISWVSPSRRIPHSSCSSFYAVDCCSAPPLSLSCLHVCIAPRCFVLPCHTLPYDLIFAHCTRASPSASTSTTASRFPHIYILPSAYLDSPSVPERVHRRRPRRSSSESVIISPIVFTIHHSCCLSHRLWIFILFCTASLAHACV